MFKIIDIPSEQFCTARGKPLHPRTKAILLCPKGKCVDLGAFDESVRASIIASSAWRRRSKRVHTRNYNGRLLAWCEPAKA